MTEFNPEEIAKRIFEEINECHQKVRDFLRQEHFYGLTPLLAIEICEREMPLPAKHLSLSALSRYHPLGSGVTVDSNVTQMLSNDGVETQETYIMSEKIAQEIYKTLIRQGFKPKSIPKYLQVIGAPQINDLSGEYPPQNASYENGVEVYLLSNCFHTDDKSRKVIVSKKVDVELAKSSF